MEVPLKPSLIPFLNIQRKKSMFPAMTKYLKGLIAFEF